MLSALRPCRALVLFGSLVSVALAGACENRVYKPPVNTTDAAAGGGDDAAIPGSGMDFGFTPPDTNSQTTPDVGIGTGVDLLPLPVGPVCGDGKVEAPE